MLNRTKLFLMIAVVASFACATAAFSAVGLRLGTYTDFDELFIGGEYITPIATKTFFNPNIEYVFLDHADMLAFNVDLHYDFMETARTLLWAGGGLAIQYLDFEGDNNSSTEAALNVLFGAALKTRGTVLPYVQGKFVLGGYDDFVLAFGIRF